MILAYPNDLLDILRQITYKRFAIGRALFFCALFPLLLEQVADKLDVGPSFFCAFFCGTFKLKNIFWGNLKHDAYPSSFLRGGHTAPARKLTYPTVMLAKPSGKSGLTNVCIVAVFSN